MTRKSRQTEANHKARKTPSAEAATKASPGGDWLVSALATTGAGKAGADWIAGWTHHHQSGQTRARLNRYTGVLEVKDGREWVRCNPDCLEFFTPDEKAVKIQRGRLILLLALVLGLIGPDMFWNNAAANPPAGMVLIPAQDKSFLMGWTAAEAGTEWACYVGKHKVTFTYDFYMDATPVTQADYLKLMGVNPSGFTNDLRNPVEKVSWYDAVLYCDARSVRDHLEPAYTYTEIVRSNNSVCNLKGLAFHLKKNGYRLPTNAEYEYTERNDLLENTFFFTDTTNNLNQIADAYAWDKFNSGGHTHPVAQKQPHPLGLYDLIGNVFEWCNDWEGPYPTTDQVDPIGPPDGKTECGTHWIGSEKKVAKGGSYKTDVLGHMRINYHYKWPPATMAAENGFRCVRTVE